MAKVYEEDIEAAVEKAVNILGPQGRMLVGRNVSYNQHVTAPAFGPAYSTVWYGDLDLATDMDKIIRLSKELNTPLSVVDEDARFN